jgi:aryl-alcohol dehydrogenase-like predicted oxidoreductase
VWNVSFHPSASRKAPTDVNLDSKIAVYSPLGRGWLSGGIRKREDMDPNDVRAKMHPRFSEENFPGNLKLVEVMDALAKEKGCSLSQLALAWVMAQGDGELTLYSR